MQKIILSVMFILFAVARVQAVESFTVEDIRVDGLQRITEGTVLNYLPVKEGDRLTTRSAQDAIRALFDTGFFRDISLARDGDILVVEVAERPAISDLTIEGNKAIKTEELRKALGGIGLTEGEIFNQQKLDVVEGELTRQYFSRGKYSVNVSSEVTPLERNRVSVRIQIDEGETAKIKHINVVGNEVFEDDTLIGEFESDTTGWLSWYSKDDQYSREKLGGDLETLRAYYLDRGYLDFSLESAQVSITPDKRKIAITANVSEGETYTVTDTSISGETVVPREELRELIDIEPGQVFSRKQVEETADKITAVLGNVGYAFANVTPVPEMDEENREVSINFFVDPGNRVYVRRIEFFGNYKTRDEVLRREMRQFEGAWFSQAAVERSRIRLQRLGYFANVNIETPQVPGTEDQVDIHVTVEERPAGSFVTGFGYSQTAGVIFSAQVRQRNFLGTGKFVTVGANVSDFSKQVNASYVNPYYTKDGISRGFSFGYSTFDQRRANIADYNQKQTRLGTNLGIPVSEVSNLRLGLSADRTSIETGPNTPQDILDFLEREGSEFDTIRASTQFTRDTRNSYFNPDRGSLNRIGVEFATPGSNSEYYKLSLKNEVYWPLNDTFTLSVGSDLGFGEGYGDSDQLPFFENFFGGGPRSVRGYEANTLGPKDQFNNPVGGALKVTGSVELLFPPPLLSDVADTRFAAFLDFGNVYRDYDSFEAGDLRYSVGIGTTWQAPVGPISLSVAMPFNDQPGDRTEVVQFLFGNVF
jgi:outer membrane protein insertion porin family